MDDITLVLESFETKLAEFESSVDPDEVAHNEPPHLDLHCFSSIPLFRKRKFCRLPFRVLEREREREREREAAWTLSYGTEIHRNVVRFNLGFTIRRLENYLCQPSSKWLPFSNQGRVRQRKESEQKGSSF